MKTYGDKDLQAVREAWEVDLPLVYESPIYKYGMQLAITTQKKEVADKLKIDIRDVYTCYRYFKLGDKWVCSVDLGQTDLKGAFTWLAGTTLGNELERKDTK